MSGKSTVLINRILEAICAVILAAAVLIAFISVIFRYAIGSSLSWSFEVSLALLTYLTFLGCYLAMRKRSHLKVEVLVQMLPRSVQLACFVVNQLLIIGIALVMTYYGTLQTLVFYEQTTLVMEISRAYLYAAIPLSGLLMALDSTATLYVGLQRYARGETRVGPDDPAFHADI